MCGLRSHSMWSSIAPTYVLLLSFVRCQLTVGVTLFTVVATKVQLNTSLHPTQRTERNVTQSP